MGDKKQTGTIIKDVTSNLTYGNRNIIKNAALMPNADFFKRKDGTIGVEFTDEVAEDATIITRFSVPVKVFAVVVVQLISDGMDADLFIVN